MFVFRTDPGAVRVLGRGYGLLLATLRTEPRWPRPWRTRAVQGAGAFCVQTVVLDGLVWVWPFTPPA